MVKKKRKKHDKIILLAKINLNTFKLLISKSLFDSWFNHDKFVLVKNLLKEYNAIKEEIKNSKNVVEHTI